MARTRRDQLWIRAAGRCEYCQIPQDFDVRPFQVDHIRAAKHRGTAGCASERALILFRAGRSIAALVEIQSQMPTPTSGPALTE
jgi:hypothetical protein